MRCAVWRAAAPRPLLAAVRPAAATVGCIHICFDADAAPCAVGGLAGERSVDSPFQACLSDPRSRGGSCTAPKKLYQSLLTRHHAHSGRGLLQRCCCLAGSLDQAQHHIISYEEIWC
ncbi:MAG: hypothetical protein J3K34DRAFT_406804 [Monoraphidium minutum]|nr:MAG: hypothetical protein J3K34DRAFT_406804 [Monoraphidium minutum]